MADKQDLILKELQLVKNEVLQVGKEVQQVKQDVNGIKEWQQKTDSRLERIEVNQERHEKMITQLLQIVGATNNRVIRLEDRVDMLEENISKLTTSSNLFVESMEKVMERLEKQDELIHLLTARSIEQDREIQELKRMKTA